MKSENMHLLTFCNNLEMTMLICISHEFVICNRNGKYLKGHFPVANHSYRVYV